MTRTFRLAFKAVIILIAALAAVLIASIILWMIGADVGATFYTICIVPLTNTLHITEVLIRAIPLCIIALGITVAYRSGIINIGGEGQMAIGILAFTGVALAFPSVPRPLLLPIALFAAVIGGGLWGFIPGILKARLNVSELLSTVMLNYIAAQFYSLCLRTIYLDPAEQGLGAAGTPQSMRLTENVWLGRISGRLHYGLLFALVLAALIFFLMWKTTLGFRMRASGSEARAARYGGINVAFYVTLAMIISGTWAATTINQANVTFDYEMLPFPSYDGRPVYLSTCPDTCYAISASASPEKQEASRRFLEFLLSSEALGKWLQTDLSPNMAVEADYNVECFSVINDMLSEGAMVMLPSVLQPAGFRVDWQVAVQQLFIDHDIDAFLAKSDELTVDYYN